MDVTRPSTPRRLGVALAGLGVAVLAVTVGVLSFSGLRDLALRGGVSPGLAFLYPLGFDTLLAVALVGVSLLTSGRLLARVQAAVLLGLLIVSAAAVDVSSADTFQLDVRQAAVVAAIAPWAMLTIALWLWLVLFRHAQARRTSPAEKAEEGGRGESLVPQDPPGEPQPARTPPPAHEPPLPHAQTDESAARCDERARRSEESSEREAAEPPRETTAEPPLPTVPEPTPSRESLPVPEELSHAPEEEGEDAPVRWGDLARSAGDLLVHPHPADAEGRGADTQPVHVLAECPDSAHGPDLADPSEAPSSRRRSMPLPPEDAKDS